MKTKKKLHLYRYHEKKEKKTCSYKNILFFCIDRISKTLSSCSDLRLVRRSLIIKPPHENCRLTLAVMAGMG